MVHLRPQPKAPLAQHQLPGSTGFTIPCRLFPKCKSTGFTIPCRLFPKWRALNSLVLLSLQTKGSVHSLSAPRSELQ